MVHSSQVPGRRKPDVEVWIAQARHGSPDALGRLLQTCRQYLLLIANQKLPEDLQGRVGASDLVQDTMLEAQRDFGRFHGTSGVELRAWLFRILVNNLANLVRAQRDTGKRDLVREVPLAEVPPEVMRDCLAVGIDTPGSVAQARERADFLRRALAKLPERSRQIIQWRNYERCTFKTIGERLQCSEEAARKLWSRALKELHEILEPLDEFPPP